MSNGTHWCVLMCIDVRDQKRDQKRRSFLESFPGISYDTACVEMQKKQLNLKRLGYILLAISVLLILFATVLFRVPNPQKPQLELFWSYKAWFAGNASLGREIVLNILLFVPLGFSMALITKKTWMVIVAVLVLTIATETIQLIFGLGLFEWDDIFNNTLGAVIGLGLAGFLQHEKNSSRS